MLSLISALLLSGCDLEVTTGAQLATLTTAAQRGAYRFEVSVHDGGLNIQLLSGTAVVRSREVPASGTCEDDARVAAVVLSAWMAQPDPAPGPRPVAKPAPRPAPVKPGPARLAATSLSEPVPPTPVEPEPVTPAVAQQEDADPPDLPSGRAHGRARWGWSASLELGEVLGGGGAAELTLRAEAGGRFGVVAEATAAMERDQVVGEGTFYWSREFGSVGVRVRWVPEKGWLIDASLSVAAGWVFVRGVGVTPTLGSGGIDGGGCVGVLVGGYELGPVGVFISARACGWPWAPRLAEGVDPSFKLPVVEGVMGVGVMWGGRDG